MEDPLQLLIRHHPMQTITAKHQNVARNHIDSYGIGCHKKFETQAPRQHVTILAGRRLFFRDQPQTLLLSGHRMVARQRRKMPLTE